MCFSFVFHNVRHSLLGYIINKFRFFFSNLQSLSGGDLFISFSKAIFFSSQSGSVRRETIGRDPGDITDQLMTGQSHREILVSDHLITSRVPSCQKITQDDIISPRTHTNYQTLLPLKPNCLRLIVRSNFFLFLSLSLPRRRLVRCDYGSCFSHAGKENKRLTTVIINDVTVVTIEYIKSDQPIKKVDWLVSFKIFGKIPVSEIFKQENYCFGSPVANSLDILNFCFLACCY